MPWRRDRDVPQDTDDESGRDADVPQDTDDESGRDADVPQGAGGESGRDADVPQDTGAGRRATLLAVLTAVIVLAAGTAVWSGLRADSAHGGNAALADTAATAEVADQVASGVKAIFSYDYGNLARTERAASSVLVDAAVGQYQASLPAAEQQATDQKLVRTTTISSIGVQDLRGDTARVLIFLDQQTLNTTSNQQSTATAALAVTARKADGAWKIASMTAL